MTDSMRERLARRMYLDLCAPEARPEDWDEIPTHIQDKYRHVTAGQLDELREPSEGMIEAAADHDAKTPGYSGEWDLIYQAMIDAAKEGK
jgi:hypothetical protein|tara:strand:+ start:477 stop:746 length:270 start_codon:yes stop_codon:yes gene_type:complete